MSPIHNTFTRLAVKRSLQIFFIVLLPFGQLAASCTKDTLSECISASKQAYKKGDYKEAVRLLEIPCDLRHGPTCGLIGAILRDGKGDVKKDPTKALAYMKKACEGRYPKSCMDMGILYQSMKKVDAAIGSYEKGCAKNDLGSCYNLATMYYFGDGVLKAPKKAKMLYKKACTLGDNKKACERYEKLSKIE